MNEINLDYLKRQLFYLEFGDKMNHLLERVINRYPLKFTLGMSNFSATWKILIIKRCTLIISAMS